MEVVIWSRVSSQTQDNQRQILSLKEVAAQKGWKVKRVFTETISGTISTQERKEFGKLLEYVKANNISIVMVSEISRIGRRVVDILNTVDLLHKNGVGLFLQQFNMISFEGGKENPMAMLLFQVLSIGAQMENEHRKLRQAEGVRLAKLQNKYKGRKSGSQGDRQKMLKKYSNVVELLKKTNLSLRSIAKHTDRSINTVRKVKAILLGANGK